MRGLGRWVRGVTAVVGALPVMVAAGPSAAQPTAPVLRGGLVSLATGPAAGMISTVVGGVGGPAAGRRVAVSLCGQGNPCPLTFALGRLWFGDENHAVRALSIASGRLTTAAGNGLSGSGGNGGLASAAMLIRPGGTSVDSAGNLFFTDLGTSTVRVVAEETGTFFGQAMTAGHIYLVAGNGRAVFSGDGGPAIAAGLLHPTDVSVDAAGNLVIGSGGDQSGPVPIAARVRVVAAASGTFYGQVMTAGDIYTVAGGDTGVAVSGNGGPAVGAGLGLGLGSVLPDPAGNLIIADGDANQVRVVAAASGSFYGHVMKAGDIYAVAGTGIPGFSGDGGPATAAELRYPAGATVDRAGNLVIAASGNNRVRVVAEASGTFYGVAMTAGNIYTVAGGGTKTAAATPALSTALVRPRGIAVDSAGNLLIAGGLSHQILAVAAATGEFYGIAMTDGRVYPIAGTRSPTFSGDGLPGPEVELDQPWGGVAADRTGDVFVSDTMNHRVRMVAGPSGQLFGRAVRSGRTYTLASTGSGSPYEMTTDHAGNLLFIDGRAPSAGGTTIDVIAAATGAFYGQHMTVGHVYSIAGGGSKPPGNGGPALQASLGFGFSAQLAIAANGNLVIADSGTDHILMIPVATGTFFGQAMTAEHIYIIAGSGAYSYDFSHEGQLAIKAGMTPWGVTVDNAGNVIIADVEDDRIFAVPPQSGTFYGLSMKADHIYTIIGDGTSEAPGISPTNLAVDHAGNILINADEAPAKTVIAVVKSGTYFGQQMQAGNVYTIAGGGPGGGEDGLGDGGLGVNAILAFSLIGIAVGPGGAVYIDDLGDNRIRKVIR